MACRRALTPEGKYVLIGHDNYGQGMRRIFGLIPRMIKLMLMALLIKQLPKPSCAAFNFSRALWGRACTIESSPSKWSITTTSRAPTSRFDVGR